MTENNQPQNELVLELDDNEAHEAMESLKGLPDAEVRSQSDLEILRDMFAGTDLQVNEVDGEFVLSNAEEQPKPTERTKLFLDTEFTGLKRDADLISIGLISECGQTFYAELTCFDPEKADAWVHENVIANLILTNMPEDYIMTTDSETVVRGCHGRVARELRGWFEQFGPAEIWMDLGAYDWVLLLELFGGAFGFAEINPNIYYIPFDLSTRLYERGIDPDINREEFAQVTEGVKKHHALFDAVVIKACWNRLEGMAPQS